MFWGNGDSSKLNEDERKTLDELRRLGETGHLIGLTPEQTAVALAAIKFYQSVTATTGLIAGARNVALFIGSLLLIWWSVRDAIVAFVKTHAGG